MHGKRWVTAVATASLLGAAYTMGRGGAAVAETVLHCSESTLRGTFGVQMQGTRPVPAPLGGGIETVTGVVVRTYDGAGGLTQVDNIKGTITGIVPDRPGAGTYQVNPDCSGVAVFQPGPGILIEERFVIVDNGKEVRSMVSSPLAIAVTGVQKRIRR